MTEIDAEQPRTVKLVFSHQSGMLTVNMGSSRDEVLCELPESELPRLRAMADRCNRTIMRFRDDAERGGLKRGAREPWRGF